MSTRRSQVRATAPSPRPGAAVARTETPAQGPGAGVSASVPGAGQAIPNAAPAPGAPRTWVVELPAGLELLSLNGRDHHMKRYRIGKALKKAAWAKALQRPRVPRLGRVSIVVEYQPPDRRHRDAENIGALSGKACIDGLVRAGVIRDDECPRYVGSVRYTIGPVYPRGRLVLHVTEEPPLEVIADAGT